MTEPDERPVPGAAHTAPLTPGGQRELLPVVAGALTKDAAAVQQLAAALDRRFPGHNTPGDRLGRLLEELGELSEAVLVDQDAAHITKELRDVLVAVAGISQHYQLPIRLDDHGGSDLPVGWSSEVPVLLAQLTAAAGTVAKNVHHQEGTGSKRARYGPPVPARLAGALDELIGLVLALATHSDLQDAVHATIRDDCDRYRQAGCLGDDDTQRSAGTRLTTEPPAVSSLPSTPRGASQYTTIAERYRTSSRRYFDADHYRDLLRNWAGLSDHHSVIVDIGCGEGTFTNFLHGEFPGADNVVGIDASEDMIRLARNDYPAIDFRVEDMCSLSLTDATADLVCSRFAVHYSDNLAHTLAEIGRVTMPGGIFVFEDAHPFYATFLKPSLDYERKEHVRFPVLSDDELSAVHPSFTFEEYITSFRRTGWSLQAMREVYGRHSSGPSVAPQRVPTSLCFLLGKP